ncbi:siderophore ABC transporter substrate-binding protein [Nocardiopsis algeriensis]|uniref:siderophore ABC transporter substrate-binding protein n=1 Tax=Nocardiopsis algeriensis TaxID=1478215 RepID=UPI003B438B68
MSPRSAAFLSAIPLSALILAGCSAEDTSEEAEASAESGGTVTVTAANGEVEVAQNPQTVVVFDNVQLDILDALGVEIAGIPSAEVVPEFFSEYAEDESVANVGSLFEPDFEAVAALEPDLIISGGRSAEVTGDLEEIAPTIDMSVDTADLAGSLAERARTYGEIFDKTEEAEQLVSDFETRVDEVSAKLSEAGDGLVIMTNAGEFSAYGPGSRYGFFYDSLGLEASVEVESDGRHGEVMSFEGLAEADPDWLLVLDRDAAIATEGSTPAEQVLDNELVDRTTAAEEDQIVYLDSQELYLVGGIQAYMNAMDTVDAAISE